MRHIRARSRDSRVIFEPFRVFRLFRGSSPERPEDFPHARLRTLPVARLIPAPYNPRVALRPGDVAYERLARSLDEFDLVQPLVWNERSGHVVGGHQRLTILVSRGATEVPVVVVDLPPDRERALNVALNNAHVAGDWEPAKLVDLLGELQALPDFDATLTGFDQQELDDLLFAPVPELDPLDDDLADTAIRAELVVPPDRWDAVRPDLDTLVADHDLEVHVRLPRG
jgi:hypothetical protein